LPGQGEAGNSRYSIVANASPDLNANRPWLYICGYSRYRIPYRAAFYLKMATFMLDISALFPAPAFGRPFFSIIFLFLPTFSICGLMPG
jgi:hypothetical protein